MSYKTKPDAKTVIENKWRRFYLRGDYDYKGYLAIQKAKKQELRKI